jgi:LysM repeat protein
LQLLALGEETPANATQRRGLLQQQELAYRNALGPARYRQYLDSLDPVMRSAVAAATDAGVPEVAPILETIERLGQEEEAIINALPGSELEREIARKRLEIEQLEAAAAALGQPVTPSEPPAPPQNRYSVGRGETIADVSRKTGVPVALLIEANPGLQVNNLPAGTSLIIPPWSAPPGFR